MDQPLVSVICLCHNHERFVRESIESVINQTYPNIEIIIVDDASTDNSVHVIQSIVNANQNIRFIALSENVGNCKAFNRGYALSDGDYIVDLATDDVFHPDRIASQISHFSKFDSSYGVLFTNAIYIDEYSKPFRNHFEYLISKRLISNVPQGDVYANLLSTYFIASPTMLVRREVLDRLTGYDETLSYEDFDFWIRSSRYFKYIFLDEPLTYIRRVKKSLSTKLYEPGDRQLYSTYLVCLKAVELNRSEKDTEALIQRLQYELRHAVLSGSHHEATLFYRLLCRIGKPSLLYHTLNIMNITRLPLSWLRRFYHNVRFGRD